MVQGLGLYLVVLNNLIPLNLSIRNLLRLFKVIVLLLLSEKALDLVIGEGESLASHLRKIVNKADHGLCALGIKFVVVAGLDL